MTEKKKNRKALKIFLSVLLAVITGFVLFFIFSPFKAIDVVLPDLKGITQINAKIKGDSILADISFIFKNRSLFKIKIDTLSYSISLHDQLLIEEAIPVDLDQIRGQTDTLKLPLNVSLKKFHSILDQLSNDDSTNLTLNSYVIVKTIFGKIKVPFNKEERIAVPVPPKVKVVNVSGHRYNLRDKILRALVRIEIINDSKVLDFEVSEIRYHLVVKNNLSSKGTIKESVVIKPASREYIDIPVVINMDRPLKTAIAVALNRDRFPYTLHLTCILHENMMREGHDMPLDISASGMMELKD